MSGDWKLEPIYRNSVAYSSLLTYFATFQPSWKYISSVFSDADNEGSKPQEQPSHCLVDNIK